MTQCFIDEDGSELDELPVQVVIEVPWDPQAMVSLFRKSEGVMIRKASVLPLLFHAQCSCLTFFLEV